MAKDDKTSAVAAAQLVIDDEPDEWYDLWISYSSLTLHHPFHLHTNIQPQTPRPTNTCPCAGPRDKRIFSTGCADENAKLTDCYYEKKDWRACKAEMEIFRQCWRRYGNDRRTGSKDVE
ncbi:hypothetical protein IAQ61_002523 [Plenodomus lingam]|uniref:uncharacterized protein n=1 Tax=Leptosphaeria maculans TaxID=5022 RepID=UPI0033278E5C|nr:hypothetical protein IAQ61_002523 [Plenodomus lingam]